MHSIENAVKFKTKVYCVYYMVHYGIAGDEQ